MLSLLSHQRGLCTFEVLMLTHREHLLRPQLIGAGLQCPGQGQDLLLPHGTEIPWGRGISME